MKKKKRKSDIVFVQDDRFHIPDEIMGMSKEEIEVKIAEYEAGLEKYHREEQNVE